MANPVVLRLSGGSANTNPNASLGGEISDTVIETFSYSNLFDFISYTEATSGDIEYRCAYVYNGSTYDLVNMLIWIGIQTISDDTYVRIGLGTSDIGGVEQTIAEESTAPTDVVFSNPLSEETALEIGNVPAGSWKAIWIRRVVTPNANAKKNDGCVLAIKAGYYA